jgi:pre-mycofactocin synthase
MGNPWFESVAVAQERARRKLPNSVYKALIAGSESGTSMDDNVAAFSELRLSPITAGQPRERQMATTVMGQPLSMPVMVSPTGVQAHRRGHWCQPADHVPDLLGRR